jgi:hypothetical protein
MRKTLVAIAAAAAAMLPGAAYAKPHHQITDAQRLDCLTTDNDPDGTEWCVKSIKGMTQAQIDAWYDEEDKKLFRATTEPNYKNCMRAIDAFKSNWVWSGGPPSEEDCRPFAAESIAAAKAAVQARRDALDARARAHIHHTLNEEIMKQCNRMADTPGTDWQKVAAFRGITVSLDDCVKASAELAAELKQ